MNSLKKLLLLSALDKKLFFKATIISVWVKCMVSFFPLRWYAKKLGEAHAVSSEESTTSDDYMAFKISQSIVRSRKALPWKTSCLTDAITAKILLKHKRIVSTLYLGVYKKNSSITAHAWLRVGTTYVTGKREMQKFVVVSTFT
jgi:hypothetical protein